MDEHGLARALGWVSVGVGFAAVAVRGPLMKAIGLGYRPKLGRLLGARDLVLGAGLLLGRTQRAGAGLGASPMPWTWRSSSAGRPPGPSGGTRHRSGSPQGRASAP
jgi:hypothetical protein